MAQVVELLPGMNHHPAYPGIWVPFRSYRMKDRYDIKLKTGEIYRYYYPNGGSFAKWTAAHDGPDRVEDDEIAEIRLLPDDELTEQYFHRGAERIERNLRMFGDVIPKVEVAEDGTVTFIPITRRIFDEMVVSSWSGEPGMWMLPEELTVEELKAELEQGKGDIDPYSPVGTSLHNYLSLLCKQAKYVLSLLEVPWEGRTFHFNLEHPTDYQRSACLNAVLLLEGMAATQKEKDAAEQKEANRVAKLGFTPSGKSARRSIALTTLTAQLAAAVDRKIPGGGKYEKDDRYITKAEARVIDGKKITGKQLRKLEKKQRREAREVGDAKQ